MLEVSAGGETIITVSGTFDLPAAVRLVATCKELTSTIAVETVTIDFSHAGEVSNTALAFIVGQQPAGDGPRLLRRGLTRRQNRLLRYLGHPA